MKYFEDLNLSPTQKLEKLAVFGQALFMIFKPIHPSGGGRLYNPGSGSFR